MKKVRGVLNVLNVLNLILLSHKSGKIEIRCVQQNTCNLCTLSTSKNNNCTFNIRTFNAVRNFFHKTSLCKVKKCDACKMMYLPNKYLNIPDKIK